MTRDYHLHPFVGRAPEAEKSPDLTSKLCVPLQLGQALGLGVWALDLKVI